MSTSPFDVLKGLVYTLGLLEEQLTEYLSRLSGVLHTVKQLLQEQICDHRSTSEWRDYSDYHRSEQRKTCNDCHKWLR
jgi:hypothetical protein